ncbi:MAG: UDP-3-O-(3-hydroxymyristoyl)glucosamine N-acyltransferase [bacterium]|nr:UDP-3-O-(3-hydroxymyristoyl)glucosamine N-acyltransferase [bacterium]
MRLSEIAKEFHGELIGEDAEIVRLARLEDADNGDLSFLSQSRYRELALKSKATAILISREEPLLPKTVIRVDNPYQVYTELLLRFYKPLPEPTGIHPSAIIGDNVKLGNNVAIGPLCCIGENTVIGDDTILVGSVFIGREVEIGSNCKLYPMVVIRDRVKIGNRAVIKDGAVIGSDGFAFLPDASGKYHPVPQLGTVEIGDDVSIGANTCIDRALSGATKIGSGVKLDNLIQVAHNVTIQENTVIAAQTGISGSTKIGKRNKIGGQVGFGGHLKVGDDVTIGAQSGIISNIQNHSVLWGTPAFPHQMMLRIVAFWKKLPEIIKRLEKLEMELLKDKKKNGH